MVAPGSGASGKLRAGGTPEGAGEMTKPKLLERHIEETCSRFLELDGWRWLKTDTVSRREWGKGFGEAGMADGLYLRYWGPSCGVSSEAVASQGNILWIEWKRATTRTKRHQDEWHMRERARGGKTIKANELPGWQADPIAAFFRWYSDSGLMWNGSLRIK